MRTVPLGEIITPAANRRAEGSEYPILSMTMHGGLIDQASKFKKRIASEDVSAYKVVRRGQLVVGFPIDEGVLDIQNIYDFGIVSPAYGIWDVPNSSEVCGDYLKRFLRSPRAMSYYKAKLRGSTARRRSLPREVFLALAVPLPPLDQQRRIAEILDHADDLKRKRRAAEASLAELQDSVFVEMFGGLPKRTLGSGLDFVTSGGRGWAKYYAKTGEPFLRSLDVQMNHIAIEELAFVDAPDNAEARRTRTREGDVLLTITGSRIGRAAPIPEGLAGAYVSQHVAILRPRQDVFSPDYLSSFLCSMSLGQRQIRAAQYGQTKPGLNFDQIRDFRIPAADLEHQHVLRNVMAAARQLVAKAQLADEELAELVASLQSRAFSGQL